MLDRFQGIRACSRRCAAWRGRSAAPSAVAPLKHRLIRSFSLIKPEGEIGSAGCRTQGSGACVISAQGNRGPFCRFQDFCPVLLCDCRLPHGSGAPCFKLLINLKLGGAWALWISRKIKSTCCFERGIVVRKGGGKATLSCADFLCITSAAGLPLLFIHRLPGCSASVSQCFVPLLVRKSPMHRGIACTGSALCLPGSSKWG